MSLVDQLIEAALSLNGLLILIPAALIYLGIRRKSEETARKAAPIILVIVALLFYRMRKPQPELPEFDIPPPPPMPGAHGQPESFIDQTMRKFGYEKVK